MSRRIAFFDARAFEREHFDLANAAFGHELVYFEPRLTAKTAQLAKGFDAVCCFVNDRLDEPTLRSLHGDGLKLIALRCAGYNQVDLRAAESLGLTIVRVPEYSPYAVAEHAIALVLALDRKIHRAHARVHEMNFSLEGLVGFDLHGKTVGIIGTGRIGVVTARIFTGFGCQVLAYDLEQAPELTAMGAKYVELIELYERCDIISLHVPLTPATQHLIDAAALARMKKRVMIINTSRGALIDSKALIDALKTGHVGSAGLDVYEEEAGIFFQNLSEQVLQDDVLARLLSFPNVLITSHQAFLTEEALTRIAEVTLENVTAFERGDALANQVRPADVLAGQAPPS